MEYNPHEYKGLNAIIFTLQPLSGWSQQTFWAEGTVMPPYVHRLRESAGAPSSTAWGGCHVIYQFIIFQLVSLLEPIPAAVTPHSHFTAGPQRKTNKDKQPSQPPMNSKPQSLTDSLDVLIHLTSITLNCRRTSREPVHMCKVPGGPEDQWIDPRTFLLSLCCAHSVTYDILSLLCL